MSARSGSHGATGWEEAGRGTASLISDYTAIAVVSSDPNAAAEVALGIARAESKHRRAVVGDLVGDLAPLSGLVTSDDPHGISDSFLYGISLSSIGREVAGEKNLVIMLSGVEPVFDEEIIASRRWERLAAGFGEVGALLLLVAQADTPGLDVLLTHLDGVILVRDQEIPAARDALVLARVPAPALLTMSPNRPREEELIIPAPGRARALFLTGGAVLLIGGLGFVGFRIFTSRRQPPPSAAAPAPRLITLAPAETLYVSPPANPGDAPIAAAFAVELLAANTAEAANLELRRSGALLPVPTVTPVPIGPERATWYKLIAGAYRDRAEGDSLLAELRASKLLDDSSGRVIHAPLALLLESLPSHSGLTPDWKKRVDAYATRDIPVYALVQDDGGANIYAGAFEGSDQAGELLKALRAQGLSPMLVYRTGHVPR